MDEHDGMALPEKLLALADFEAAADIVTGTTSSKFHGHHEEGHSLQTRFANDLTSLPTKAILYCHEMVLILSRLTPDGSWVLTQPTYSAVPTQRGIL